MKWLLALLLLTGCANTVVRTEYVKIPIDIKYREDCKQKLSELKPGAIFPDVLEARKQDVLAITQCDQNRKDLVTIIDKHNEKVK